MAVEGILTKTASNRITSPCCARPAIICLFFIRGPTAVLLRITAIVINALDSGSRKPTRLHLLNKSSWRFQPFLADANSASAVVLKGVACWIQTAGTHIPISGINRADLTSRFVSMPVVFFTHKLFTQAATTSRIAADDEFCCNSKCIAASALKQPNHLGILSFLCRTNSGQPSKCLTSNFERGRHKGIYGALNQIQLRTGQ